MFLKLRGEGPLRGGGGGQALKKGTKFFCGLPKGFFVFLSCALNFEVSISGHFQIHIRTGNIHFRNICSCKVHISFITGS